MNINPKTIYIVVAAMSNAWCGPATGKDDYGACPPKLKRKRLKGYQKGRKK